MPITDPSQEYFKDGTWGWNGSAWVKLGIVWNYAGTYRETVSAGNATAGTNYLNGAVVPAGEVWVVQHVQAVDVTSGIASIEARLVNGGYLSSLLADYSPVADHFSVASGGWLMAAGEKLQFRYAGCVLNDNLEGQALGYKMKVA